MEIYIETNLWNELFNQTVDAGELCDALATKNARLVLGRLVVLETRLMPEGNSGRFPSASLP